MKNKNLETVEVVNKPADTTEMTTQEMTQKGINFVIESIIPSGGIRAARFSDLDQEQMEALTTDIHTSIEESIRVGASYHGMGPVVDRITASHLEAIVLATKEPTPSDKNDKYIKFSIEDKWWAFHKTSAGKKATAKVIGIFNSLSILEQEALGSSMGEALHTREFNMFRDMLIALAEQNVDSAIENGVPVSDMTIGERIEDRVFSNEDDTYIRYLGAISIYTLAEAFVEHEVFYEREKRKELGLQAENTTYLEWTAHHFIDCMVIKLDEMLDEMIDEMVDEIAKFNRGLEDRINKVIILDKEINMTIYRKNDREIVFECENLQDERNPHKIILDDKFKTYEKLVSTIEEANKENKEK